jgi:hypothetical protein
MTTRAYRLLRSVLLGLAGLLLVSACVAASPSPTPTPASSPTASPSASGGSLPPATPTPTASATPSPTTSPTPTGSAAACALPLPGPLASDTLTGAALEKDRLVFTFGSRPPEAVAQPVVGIVFAEPPFSMAGSGQPVAVFGDRFLEVRMDGMVVARPNGDPVFKGERDLRLAGGTIPEAVMVDESEGVVTWIVGLSGSGCPTIRAETSGGTRLIVELAG